MPKDSNYERRCTACKKVYPGRGDDGTWLCDPCVSKSKSTGKRRKAAARVQSYIDALSHPELRGYKGARK